MEEVQVLKIKIVLSCKRKEKDKHNKTKKTNEINDL